MTLRFYNPDFIPDRVGGVLSLLDMIDDEAELSPQQVAAIRRIMHLDDDRTVKERVLAGEVF